MKAGNTKNLKGIRDSQTVVMGGGRAQGPKVSGVKIIELGNVLTRSGWMMELFRKDWPGISIAVQQVNWVELSPNGVTDWHRHTAQTDHLIAVGGVIKLALWDGREASDVIRMGALRPVMVVVPPGIWHALRNESGQPAGYLNVIDQVYNHANPDNWRLAPGTPGVPQIL
jgi:dTDP-4-dehydrorhamnose 3,5-epimerase